MKLSIDHLFKSLYDYFDSLPDQRSDSGNLKYALGDCLMACFAIFSLKSSSLLQFRKHLSVRRSNLKRIFNIGAIPEDTAMRQTVDDVDFSLLQAVFVWLIAKLRITGLLNKKHRVKFSNTNSYHLVSVDGTGHYCSSKKSCPHCLVKKHRSGKHSYYHQCLAGVIVHPYQKTVFPAAVEPIIKQDGKTKNDCEQNSFKRILPHLFKTLCNESVIVLLDGLYQNGPCIKAITQLREGKEKWSYIIVCKEQNFVQLQVEKLRRTNQLKQRSWTIQRKGKTVTCIFRYTTGLILNGQHQDIHTNYGEFEEINATGRVIYKCAWITDLPIGEMTTEDCQLFVASARARWKVENETFNTLKNQGYHFEHNFGHGKKHLATNFGLMTFLAFAIDQIAQLADEVFQQTLIHCDNNKKFMWNRVRAVFDTAPAQSMHAIYRFIWKNKLIDMPLLI